MTQADLFAFSGGEREIFIVALQNFSDACESPSLTPQCPFYESAHGEAACGEQCHDLLAAHQPTKSPQHGLDLGNGIELVERKKRHRKGPEPTARPFDATAILLHDEDQPTEKRHTVALIKEIERNLTAPPEISDDVDERRYLVGASVRELVRRGFVYDDLHDLAVTMTSAGMIAYMTAGTLLEIGSHTPRVDFSMTDEWAAFRDLIVPTADRTDFHRATHHLLGNAILAKIQGWNRAQSLESLADWTIPEIDLASGDAADNNARISDRAMWILERFTKTYLREWSLASLHDEWKYIHSSTIGCAASSQMTLRRIDVDELARELAERSIAAREESPAIQPVRVNDFKRIAVDHLYAGRYHAAATIYEGLNALRPGDPEVKNNLGFCLIPIDAGRAVEILKDSLNFSSGALSLVTTANIAFASYVQDDLDTALFWIEKARTIRPQWEAWLWTLKPDGSFSLDYFSDVPVYVEQIRIAITQRLAGKIDG